MSLPEPINWLHRSSRTTIYFVTGRVKSDASQGRIYPEVKIGDLKMHNLYIFTDLDEAITKAKQEVMAPGYLSTGDGWISGKIFTEDKVKNLIIKEPDHQTILGSTGFGTQQRTKIIRKYGVRPDGKSRFAHQVYIIQVTL